MKKIITLLAVVGIFSLQGCTTTSTNPVDNDTVPQAFEIKNVNMTKVNNNSYSFYMKFIDSKLKGNLFDSETILVYRLAGTLDSNTPIWRLIPRTIYLDNGDELDYDFDFSKEDFTIYANGTYSLSLTPEYINGQTFRIVVLPSNLIGSIDKNNYFQAMNVLKINESQIQKINF